MGFFDALKKAGSKTKEVLGAAASAAAREIKYRQAVRKAKIELLMRFKMDDLKKICKIEGIPTYYYETDPLDPFSERKVEIRKKSDLVDKMLVVSLDDIVDYAKRYKIKFKDVIEELEEIERQLYEESEEEEHVSEELYKEREEKLESVTGDVGGPFEEILELIKEFEPEVVKSEEDFEKQLFNYLKGYFKNNPFFRDYRIERQVRVGGNRIDIVINDNYGIELKIADKRKKLQELVGQAMEYSEQLDELVAVILDVGFKVDVRKYRDMLEKLGVKVVILRGMIKRKGKSREIRIKY